MKRLLLLILSAALILSGCMAKNNSGQKQYTATYLDVFDTVTTVVGLADSQELFAQAAQDVHDRLLFYHQLFDIYNEYDGINNLKTVNNCAGITPVKVDSAIISLLLDCKEYAGLTNGRVNVAMGSVLSLWHNARTDGINDPENARLPEQSALTEAALHCDLQDVIIDEAQSTVYIQDPLLSLDVGAVAKGWAVQRVAQAAPEGLLLSVGGNVCATGPKDKSGSAWVVGIQDPDSDGYLHTLSVTAGSVVTSGDYQRAYAVDGSVYHHIIDPDTLYPSKLWRSVTVVCSDSGLADALSTALFLLPQEQGQNLLNQCGAQALWMDAQGKLYYSPGFLKLIRT